MKLNLRSFLFDGFYFFSAIASVILFSCNGDSILKAKPATARESGVEAFYGVIPEAKPLPPIKVPVNPYLSDGRNGIHYDTYNSDVTNGPGPVGRDSNLVTRKLDLLGKSIPTSLFDTRGRLITVMISFTRTFLYLIDPESLEILAEERLPRKDNIHIFKRNENDASGGGYLHITPEDEVIVPLMNNIIAFYKVNDEGTEPRWEVVKEYNLNPVLPDDTNLTDAVYDYQGQLWFTTSGGTIGYIDRDSEKIRTYTFPEGLQNQIAIDNTGVYLVTLSEMNKLRIADDGEIELVWQSSYDNGAGLNGLVSSGSGTSPTLFGNDNNLVVIADNGTPRMHLNVYHREDGRLICSIPVFSSEKTGCENSPVGYGNDILLEDNGGFDLFFGNPQDTNRGLVKIRIRDDLSGGDILWENNDLKATTTPLLSTASGLIYSYSLKEGDNGSDAWFMSLVDWETGKTVYEYWVGSGRNYPDMLQPVVLYNGAFYIGTRTGMLKIRDGVR